MPFPKGIKIVNQSADEGEISIYGYIVADKWCESDVTAIDFKAQLDALKDKKVINVFINSGGGDVFPGMAIYEMLKRATGKTVAHVDGLAASIASVVMQGCRDRVVTKNSLVMIHNVAVVAIGDAVELRKTADILDKVQEAVVACYKDRAKCPEDEIKAMMNAETWMLGQEAVDKGFADRCEEEKAAYSACIKEDGTAEIQGQAVDIKRYRAFPSAKIPKNKPKSAIPEPDPKLDLEDYSVLEAEIEFNHNNF